MSSLNDMFSARISTDFSRKLGGGEGGEGSVTPPVPIPFQQQTYEQIFESNL
jgi:hypothetical protein